MSSYTPAGGSLLETQVVTVSEDVTAPLWAVFADGELIGGGGGGGGAGSQATADVGQVGGGGGGAGQWLPVIGIPVTGGAVYPVVIGAGGSGGTGGAAGGNPGTSGTSGGNTTVFGLTAVGGGAGGSSSASQTADNGASGIPAGAIFNPYSTTVGISATERAVPGYGGWSSLTNGVVNAAIPQGPVVGGGGGATSTSTGIGGTGGPAASTRGQGLPWSAAGGMASLSGGNAQTATAPGCGGGGGGGGAGTTGAGGNGGAGANGQVTITWRSE